MGLFQSLKDFGGWLAGNTDREPGEASVPSKGKGLLVDLRNRGVPYPGIDHVNGTDRRELMAEKVRSGPRDLILPQFMPFYDNYSQETAGMRRQYRYIAYANPYAHSALLDRVYGVAALDVTVKPPKLKGTARQEKSTVFEIADYIDFCANEGVAGGMPTSIESIMFPGLVDGYSICDPVVEPVDTGTWSGMNCYGQIKTKDTSNDAVLQLDDYNNIVGVLGLRYNPGDEFGPGGLAIWTHLMPYGRPTGTSAMRCVYSPCFYWDTATKLRAIALQLRAQPVVTASYKEERTATQASLTSQLQNIAKNLFLIAPESVVFDVLDLAGGSIDAFANAEKDWSHQIKLGISGASLPTVEGTVNDGRGDTKIQKTAGDLRVWRDAKSMECVWNDRKNGLVRNLVDLNYCSPYYPKLGISGVDVQELQAEVAIDSALQALGYDLDKEELEDRYGRKLQKKQVSMGGLPPMPGGGGAGPTSIPGLPKPKPPGGGYNGPRGGRGHLDPRTGKPVYERHSEDFDESNVDMYTTKPRDEFMAEPDTEDADAKAEALADLLESVYGDRAAEMFGEQWQSFSELSEAIDRAAGETDAEPSDEQKEAGNYRKGKFRLHGFLIAIENPKGSTRSGTNAEGKPWSVTMKNHYGYLLRTESEADGDHVDVFIGPHPESEVVYVVDQVKGNGHFDEHKVMLGFHSEQEAKEAYLANYSAGWQGFSAIRPILLKDFKEWVDSEGTGEPITQAFSEQWQSFADRPKFDPIQHPRGAMGRFIRRGSDEAVGAAKAAIGHAVKNPTPHDAESLLGHLNLLTVAQLRELHGQHEIKPPGRLRAQLVESLKKRIASTAAGGEETDHSPPPKPYTGPGLPEKAVPEAKPAEQPKAVPMEPVAEKPKGKQPHEMTAKEFFNAPRDEETLKTLRQFKLPPDDVQETARANRDKAERAAYDAGLTHYDLQGQNAPPKSKAKQKLIDDYKKAAHEDADAYGKSREARQKQLHKMTVEAALKEGKPVPPEVLKDYPDLAATAKPHAPTPTAAQVTTPTAAPDDPTAKRKAAEDRLAASLGVAPGTKPAMPVPAAKPSDPAGGVTVTPTPALTATTPAHHDAVSAAVQQGGGKAGIRDVLAALGKTGLTPAQQLDAVKLLRKEGKVFVTFTGTGKMQSVEMRGGATPAAPTIPDLEAKIKTGGVRSLSPDERKVWDKHFQAQQAARQPATAPQAAQGPRIGDRPEITAIQDPGERAKARKEAARKAAFDASHKVGPEYGMPGTGGPHPSREGDSPEVRQYAIESRRKQITNLQESLKARPGDKPTQTELTAAQAHLAKLEVEQQQAMGGKPVEASKPTLQTKDYGYGVPKKEPQWKDYFVQHLRPVVDSTGEHALNLRAAAERAAHLRAEVGNHEYTIKKWEDGGYRDKYTPEDIEKFKKKLPLLKQGVAEEEGMHRSLLHGLEKSPVKHQAALLTLAEDAGRNGIRADEIAKQVGLQAADADRLLRGIVQQGDLFAHPSNHGTIYTFEQQQPDKKRMESTSSRDEEILADEIRKADLDRDQRDKEQQKTKLTPKPVTPKPEFATGPVEMPVTRTPSPIAQQGAADAQARLLATAKRQLASGTYDNGRPLRAEDLARLEKRVKESEVSPIDNTQGKADTTPVAQKPKDTKMNATLPTPNTSSGKVVYTIHLKKGSKPGDKVNVLYDHPFEGSKPTGTGMHQKTVTLQEAANMAKAAGQTPLTKYVDTI
jgi:hypothetical protein